MDVQLVMIGLNHRTAPVAVREALAVPSGAMEEALAGFGALPVAEGLLLSTCNRTELYVVGEPGPRLTAALSDYLVQLAAELHGSQLSPESLGPHLYQQQGEGVVAHLFRVAAGLDSMILGETQILGQVREAYREAHQAHTVGTLLHHLFTQAIAVGKRAQSETRIGQNAVSISYAAVELAKKVFHSLVGRRCLAIGAGETTKLTVRHLQASGVAEIIVANRTLERAQRLAEEIGGRAIGLAQLGHHLPEVDVVISATGAPGFILERGDLLKATRQRRGRPIFLFDLAVPRDLDPAIGRVEGAYLYDIDDLQAVVTANLAERAQEAKQVERMITTEVERFQSWVATREVVPTIRLLREKVEAIREQEVSRALNRLPELTERERAVIEAMSVTLVNKILNAPTQQLKGMADEGAASQAIEAITRLFELPRPDRGAVGQEGS